MLRNENIDLFTDQMTKIIAEAEQLVAEKKFNLGVSDTSNTSKDAHGAHSLDQEVRL